MSQDNQKNKSITVFDVANKAGVSKSTVSLVLTNSDKVSEKTKLKVQKAMQEVGYVYNRDAAALRSRKSNLVAIVINDLTNPYSAQLAVALEAQIRKMGMFTTLVNTGENIETQCELMHKLQEFNVAAFVVCPAPETRPEHLNSLVEKGIPVVSIMREVEGANVATVLPDNVVGTKQATQHLLAKGYQRIVFLGGNELISDYHQRLSGYQQALEGNAYCYSIESETTRNGGRLAMAQLLSEYPDAQAVVCFNDVIAYGAIETMKSQHLEPGKDIAIVGFDDLVDSALMFPALTTVHINAQEIAKAVCSALENKGSQNKTLVNVALIERESC